jgi:rubredoxin
MLGRVETCRLCGVARDEAAPSALAWARERDPDGRESWLCPDCARRHVRDIEAKLPHEWW